MALGFIISPAKKMNIVEGPPFAEGKPRYLARAQELRQALRKLSLEEARTLWCCSDRLARANYEQLKSIELDDASTAAVIAYEGIQYQHLAASVMSEAELAYLQRHLRIISGFYGVLGPFDPVIPYRLEMQARLPMAARGERPATANLYDWWGDELARCLASEFDTIVNIASVEYAKAVTPYLPSLGTQVLTCLFGTIRASDGKLVQRSTEAKAARGTYVRWCAEHQVEQAADLTHFDERGYHLDQERSTSDQLVFVN